MCLRGCTCGLDVHVGAVFPVDTTVCAGLTLVEKCFEGIRRGFCCAGPAPGGPPPVAGTGRVWPLELELELLIGGAALFAIKREVEWLEK